MPAVSLVVANVGRVTVNRPTAMQEVADLMADVHVKEVTATNRFAILSLYKPILMADAPATAGIAIKKSATWTAMATTADAGATGGTVLTG